MIRIVLLLMSFLILNGCTSASQKAPVVPASAPVQATSPEIDRTPHHVVQTPQKLSPVEHIKAVLYEQHDEWRYTPYRMGGLSKRGVDCSGFVYTTLQSRFGLEVPRTARSQATVGEIVSREQIQPGDLVFFKTNSSKTRWHVGIYVEDQQFLHASTSQGVVLSSLNDPYWRTAFQQARRLSYNNH